jgi:DNA-binding NtrC family response regulator
LKKRLLVVDDIPAVKDFIINALDTDYDVTGVANGAEALRILSDTPVDVVIADVARPDIGAEGLTAEIKERCPDVPVLAVTEYGGAENATRLMGQGAFDYIEKPFTIKKLKHTIEKALEFASLKTENRALQRRLCERGQTQNLVGNSVQLQHVREKINLVAGTNATVLITGESGVGKELVAHEVHRFSRRSDKPLVKINCASIPSSLLEKELFGREKGGYTGENAIEPGKLELANNGTILLEEIGELDHAIQARLLRVIQEGEFERAGGETPVKVDVRIIATTHRNLRDEIRMKRFREDLFYRLNVVPLDIPALRERREDIPLLINHFIERFSAESNTEAITLTEAAVEKLCGAYWKGNVRQLQNVIERAVILGSGRKLDADYFQFENEREEQLSRVEKAFRFGTIREMEKLMILNRLTDNRNNRTRSAETLDISVRTLRNKLNEYNVPKKHRQLTSKATSGASD